MRVRQPGLDVNCSPARLDLAGKLFQSGIFPHVQTVARGDKLQAPIVVELDPTSFCDLSCPECISAQLLRTKRFTRSRLRELAQEIVDTGVQAVILIGGGEPLAHPSIGDTIKILADAGVKVGLTTSGTLLSRYQDIVGRAVSWTRVSVDASTPGTYSWVRPHRSGKVYFHTVIDNMAGLAKTKSGSLGFSFLVVVRQERDGSVKTNSHEIFDAAVIARSIGCDYFEVKPTYDLGHYLLSLPEALKELLANQLAAIRGMGDESFEVISPSTMEEILAGNSIEPKEYSHCRVTELRTLLTAGGAYLCPYHRGNPIAYYGDPNTTSFDQLWKSKEREMALSRVDPRRDCQFHCIRNDSNNHIIALENGEIFPSAPSRPDHLEDPFI